MGLLDDYSQNSDDSGGASDPGDIRRQKMELESQIVISESNLKKILREREILEIEQRRLKKIQENQRYSEEEIRGLKKKMKIIQ